MHLLYYFVALALALGYLIAIGIAIFAGPGASEQELEEDKKWPI